jgi:23S rRNA (uridine2552-2'-O)-methyltransferase
MRKNECLKLSKAWIKERRREYYYKKAKEEKYRSRASYKLLQAVDKYKFIKKGDMVVDLGAAPGSWIQVANKIVGVEGYVLGVDLKQIASFPNSNIKTIIGDIREIGTLRQILKTINRKADSVISDVSPNVSGIWELDHARQIDLAQKSLEIALETLNVHGNFFIKVFQGELLDDFIKETKRCFEIIKIIKPKASRAKSAEMYILGIGLKKRQS